MSDFSLSDIPVIPEGQPLTATPQYESAPSPQATPESQTIDPLQPEQASQAQPVEAQEDSEYQQWLARLNAPVQQPVPTYQQPYQSSYQQPYQAPYQPPQQQQPTNPWGEGDYDPFDPAHQAALVQAQVNAAISPLLQTVQQAQAIQQQEQMREFTSSLDSQLIGLVEKQLPGFAGLMQQEGKNPKADAMVAVARDLAARLANKYPPQFLQHPQGMQQFLNELAQGVSLSARELGVSSAPAGATKAPDFKVITGHGATSGSGSGFNPDDPASYAAFIPRVSASR